MKANHNKGSATESREPRVAAHAPVSLPSDPRDAMVTVVRVAAPPMPAQKSITERILKVLRPYAANWSGTLGRGDLVIPQREIPRVVHDLIDALREAAEPRREATDEDLFRTLLETRRLRSVQDQVGALKDLFVIYHR